MSSSTAAATADLASPPRIDQSTIARTRFNFLQLQALVTVVLSYQVLFGGDESFPPEVHLPTVLGLLLTCAIIMFLPDRWVSATWFPGGLALIDTGIVTGLLAVSQSASSDLYLAYFVILLIATMTRTPKQMFMFFGMVCALYGLVLYREVQTTGALQEQHLLRIPLLLIMAIFYGRTVESLRTLSEFDPLTGLPNRKTFQSMANEVLGRARKTRGIVAVFFLNLDGFKLINDTLGRKVGDQLLAAVANRLMKGPARRHRLAREGSDEFAILVDQIASPQECVQFAEEVIRAMESPFNIAGREIFITTSIGISLFPQDAEDADNLMKNADAAMTRAKEQGKNTYQFYSADINAQAVQRLELWHSLRKALDRNELRVFYQPQIDVKTGNIVGLEALIRWQHPDLGLVSPAQFIGLAEETGLIGQMGEWMLRESCKQVKTWHGSGRPPIRISVNISARQLTQLDLVSLIGQTLKETGLDPQYLEIELTESLLMENKDTTIKTLHALKSLGISIAIDDFGTGYSSLSYLKRFPIDTLKIDQTFIRDVTGNTDAQAIVKAIMGMAQALKLKVIAEGVEKEEQYDLLREEGCQECQGFLFSRPGPAQDMTKLLAEWPSRCLKAI